jgi:hypothetical protein
MSTQQGISLRRRPRPRVGDVVARRISGAAIRDVMDRQDIGLKKLSSLTREADPEGRGISWELISFLASDAWWGRDTTTLASAQLIASALGVPERDLFTRETVVSRRGAAQDGSAA